MVARVLLALVLALTSGCSLLNSVEVESAGVSAQKPSNVGALLAVSDGDQPIENLEIQNFRVYENEQLIPAEQSGQLLLGRELAVAHHLLLLVDLSGSQSAGAREALAKGVAGFVESARKNQPITVYGFDGSAELKLIGQFARDTGAVADASAIAKHAPADTSRNLNGAVIRALAELDARLTTEKKPLRVGTLVLFTQGPDLAGRVSDGELRDALDKARVDALAILVAEQGLSHIDLLGKRGVIRSQSAETIPIAFEEAAMKVNAVYDRYYLLAYCSPARAGQRRLRIEVSFTDSKGEQKSGEFYGEFDATGFGPGCKPETAPRFVTPAPAQNPSAPAKPAPASPASPTPAAPAAAPAEPDNDDNVVPPPAPKAG